MPTVTFVRHDGERREIQARGGQSLMEAAIDHGVDGIEAQCGGACSCATCHVYVDDVWIGRVGPAGSLEQEMLGLLALASAGSRLACQVRLDDALDGLVVTTPASQG